MTPKQESETLMNAVLPVAENMLRRYGEFYPYGGYMTPGGDIVHVGGSDPDTDRPKSKDIIYILRSSLQEIARGSGCKATVVVFNVAVTLPNSDRRSDAIEVCLEHLDDYAAEVFLPYQLVDGEIVYGETFAQAGNHGVFAKS
jgi:uncharacterized protein YuzB (UPF0349 family)